MPALANPGSDQAANASASEPVPPGSTPRPHHHLVAGLVGQDRSPYRSATSRSGWWAGGARMYSGVFRPRTARIADPGEHPEQPDLVRGHVLHRAVDAVGRRLHADGVEFGELPGGKERVEPGAPRRHRVVRRGQGDCHQHRGGRRLAGPSRGDGRASKPAAGRR